MAIINSVMVWLMKKRYHQIELYKQYPLNVQDELLKNLINAAKTTEWGLKYNYNKIKSWEDFNAQVPTSDYNSLKPYIDRLRNGEQNILWHSEIKYFAKSSGTTSNKSKFIPVSHESLEDCHYKGGKDMLAIYCNNYPDTNIFDGYNLALGGSQQINEHEFDAYYGDLSAIIIENLPIWAEMYRTPKRELALMSEWEEKLTKMVEQTTKDNVVSLSGVPSWVSLLLQKCLEYTGSKNIKEIWENLEVFFHGGVSFLPYKERFQHMIGENNIRYVNVYNASEGYFAVQDQTDSDDMLLLLDNGVFYEFIPVEEVDNEHPTILSLKDVELNTNYAIIISTNAGLWRYIIGDTISFSSLSPFRIHISGRTKNYINVCGEEIIIDNATQAIQIACDKTNSSIYEFTVAPYYDENDNPYCHEWVIEFEKQPSNLEYFTEMLDNALKSLNSDYEAKRYKDMILHKPRLHSAPTGTFYCWLKQNNRLGGQYKVPRLYNTREHIDSLLTLLEK